MPQPSMRWKKNPLREQWYIWYRNLFVNDIIWIWIWSRIIFYFLSIPFSFVEFFLSNFDERKIRTELRLKFQKIVCWLLTVILDLNWISGDTELPSRILFILVKCWLNYCCFGNIYLLISVNKDINFSNDLLAINKSANSIDCHWFEHFVFLFSKEQSYHTKCKSIICLIWHNIHLKY